MATTIKQIAELAGVSIGTVDRALHNRGRVNEHVATRIKKIAKELNYQPNSIAKSLSIKRRNLKIAVILNVTGNQFIDVVLQGVSAAAEELSAAGFTVEIMKCKDFDAQHQLELINQAVAGNFSGIVLVPINDQKIRDRINELYHQSYPIVFLTSIIENANFLAYIGCNYKYSGQISCGILNQITGGDARLAIVISNLHMWSNQQRLLSIKEYLRMAYKGIHIEKVLELSNDSIASYLQTRELLEKNPQIDALLYCSGAVDGGLKAALEVLNKRKLRIVTFDYTDIIGQAMRGGEVLFTITQNPTEQGYRSVKLMADYLTTQQKPASQFIYVNTEIMIRESIIDCENNSGICS